MSPAASVHGQHAIVPSAASSPDLRRGTTPCRQSRSQRFGPGCIPEAGTRSSCSPSQSRRSENAARPPSEDEKSRQPIHCGRVPLSERAARDGSVRRIVAGSLDGSLAVVGCPPRWTAVICRAAPPVGSCLRFLCAAGGWWRCWPAGCAPCCWSQRAQPGRVRGWRHHKRPRALGSFGRVAGSGCSARGCGLRWNGRILGVLRSRWL
jgi:hypothetical protein